MTRIYVLLLLLVTFVGAFGAESRAQTQQTPPEPLHVISNNVNIDSENPELCLEFNAPLNTLPTGHLSSLLKLESGGKPVALQNIEASGAALCMFPLQHGHSYHLSVNGLSGHDRKMTSAYNLSFDIPDRPPQLGFTGPAFGSYDAGLTLRAVNIAEARLTLYHLNDPIAMARAWQDRAQTALVPSESAYLAKDKGQQVWSGPISFDGVRHADGALTNNTLLQKIILRDQIPDLPPGLYLIVVDTGDHAPKPGTKGLAPLAAAWFTRSAISLRAVRDNDGIHVIASGPTNPAAKDTLHLMVLNKKPEQLVTAEGIADGASLIPLPPDAGNDADIVTVIGTDPAGNVGFTDIASLPALNHLPPLGLIHTGNPFLIPGETADFSLTLAAMPTSLSSASTLKLTRANAPYAFLTVPSFANGKTGFSFAAPVIQGKWALRWQQDENTVLADTTVQITDNANGPHLESASDRATITATGDAPTLTIKSLTSAGTPAPLVGGKIKVTWQRFDALTSEWKNYQFGGIATPALPPVTVADFLTDLQGAATLHVTLPKPPAEPGLYQASIRAVAESDSGVAAAAPLILPLRSDSVAVGIRALAPDARFPQNGIAHFAVIGLASDGKPRGLDGLSYQIYEEGRSFAWYQDDGRWNYKPDPQLRPIGGGPLTIKTEGGSVVEWPVTAGNYRIQILDGNGKTLAQSAFSAGWDGRGAAIANIRPLELSMPKLLQPGHDATVHIQLPEASIVTLIVADTKIRKIIHQPLAKGGVDLTFTVGADWPNGISVTVDTDPVDPQGVPMHGEMQAAITQALPHIADNTAGFSVTPTAPPIAMPLRSGDLTTIAFALQNRGDVPDTYHYAFNAAPGLKITGGDKGTLTVGGRQSRELTITVAADTPGLKDLRLEITGGHALRLEHSWPLAVQNTGNMLHSVRTDTVALHQPLLNAAALARNAHEPLIALIGRRPMTGVPEILSYLLATHPFTTTELAYGIDALRLWNDTLTQSGFIPGLTLAARRQQWLEQLLRHQNSDGGFAATRGGDSTMTDTATALTTLGPDPSQLAGYARNLAVGWIKQRLTNTWFDDKERDARAAAYAALAAADAVDPASLHYFSDTSANGTVSALADAHIAAAFKHIHDPNAAGFWIKKMLDENSGPPTVELLNALAATDALSSDQAHAALGDIAARIDKGEAPAIDEAAAMLRVIAADNADAGDWKTETGNQKHAMSGILALRLSDPATALLHNGDSQNLFVTFASDAGQAPVPHVQESDITRHIYHLNGVELSQRSLITHGEIYMIELAGSVPLSAASKTLLIGDSGPAFRPLGCALSPHVGTLNFMPWFNPAHLTAPAGCTLIPHQIDTMLNFGESKDDTEFRIVYFARLDAKSTSDLPAPQLRLLP